jgi:hypothetical protein
MNNSDEYYKKKYLKYKYKYLQRKKKLELTGGLVGLAPYFIKKGINSVGSTAAETIFDGAMTKQLNKDKENKLKEFCRKNDLFSIMSIHPYYDNEKKRFVPNLPKYLWETSSFINFNDDEDKRQPKNHGVFVYSESGKTILYLALEKNEPKNNIIMNYIKDILDPYSSIITIKSLDDFFNTKLSKLVYFLWTCIKDGNTIKTFFKKDDKKNYLQQSKLKDHVNKNVKELPNKILEINKKIQQKDTELEELNKKKQNVINFSRNEKISIINDFIGKLKDKNESLNLDEEFQQIKDFVNNNIFNSLDKNELIPLKFIRDNLTECFKSRPLSNEEQYIKLCNRKEKIDKIKSHDVFLHLTSLKIIPDQDDIDKELAKNPKQLYKLQDILSRIDNLTIDDIKILKNLKYDITPDLEDLLFVKSNLDLCFKSRLGSDKEPFNKLCNRKELNEDQNKKKDALKVLEILQKIKIVEDINKIYTKNKIKSEIEIKLQDKILQNNIKEKIKSTVEKNTKLYKETEILSQVNDKIENYLTATNKLLDHYKNEQNAETLEAEQDVSKINSELETLKKDNEINKTSLDNYKQFKEFLDGCSSKFKMSINWVLQTPSSNNFCTAN